MIARLFTLGANRIYRHDAAAPGVILDLHVSQMDAGQVKRWITSAAAMGRCQFGWARMKRWDVPLAGLGLPDGPDISWPR